MGPVQADARAGTRAPRTNSDHDRAGQHSASARAGRTDPHDLDAERSVLGAMLLHADMVPQVAAILSPVDYYQIDHQVIAGAIAAVHARGESTDPIVVAAELERRGRGDIDAIRLTDYCELCIPAGALDHARLVAALAERRRIVERARAVQAAAADGANTEQLRAMLAEPCAALSRPARQVQVLGIDELLALPQLAWQVRGVMPAAAVGFAVSAPNTGKSILALDLVMRAVCAMDWHGRRVRAGSAVYVLGEGMSGFGNRVAAWRAHHPEARQQHAVTFATKLPPLSGPVGLLELHAVLQEHAQLHGNPAMIVLDTLAAHWAESEDKAEFAGPAMAALAALAAEYGCAILLLHHERKPQAGSGAGSGAWAVLRGSGAWAGAADFVLQLADKGQGVVELTTTKQRDAERGAPIRLQITAQELPGLCDDDGQPVRAPVLVPASGEPTADEAAETAAKRARADAAITAVVTTVRDMGGRAPSARSIVDRTAGKDGRLYAAIKEAVEVGALLPDGSGYVLPESAAPAAAPPSGGGQHGQRAAPLPGQHRAAPGSRAAGGAA